MNSVILIGNLTRDPETRQVGDMAICTFTVAVQRMKKDEADFPKVTVFGKSAENCDKYLSKGSKVAVQGRLQTGSYQNKDGVTVYTTDVIADRVEFLSNGGEKVTANRSQDSTGAIPHGFSAADEDIPF